MKKNLGPSRTLCRVAVLAALACFVCGATLPAWAVLPPKHESPRDFDLRQGRLLKTTAPLPEQRDEVRKLQSAMPECRVDFDPLLGSPKYVRTLDGFLSGPDAQGRGISAAAALAVPGTDPYRAIKAFLNDHAALFGHGAEAIDTARVKRDYVDAHNGLHTVVWEQKLDGIAVFQSVLMGHATRRGELVSIASEFLPNLPAAADAGTPGRAGVQTAPPVTLVQAVVKAGQNIGESLTAGDVVAAGGPVGDGDYLVFKTPQEAYARKVWLPLDRARLRLCWEVMVTRRATMERFQVLVDATTGEVWSRSNLTCYISNATYNVYTGDSPSPFSPGWPTPNTGQPAVTNRVLVTLAALSTNASPNGWIDDPNNITTGNNVDAFVDRNFDQQPDGPRPQGNPNRVFDFPLDLTQDPLTYSNASTVQLFYRANWYHDRLYDFGFTEAAGNYQDNNFGRGGIGNDHVICYVQSGADVGIVNNSMFQSAPDGISGQCFMFVFTGPTPNRDGSLDQEIVLHEVTHGTSWRLVGGGMTLGSLQGNGMGEGWSDFYSLGLLSEANDDPNATYPWSAYSGFQLFGLTENYYFGLRRYPYSTDMAKNPLTLKDIDPTQASAHPGVPLSPWLSPFNPASADEVHNQGEVWCVTLWEVRANLLGKHGFAGNDLMLRVVTDGMKLTPPRPTFLQARDAIILADRIDNAGANVPDIWHGFAKRGMGASATVPDSSTTIGVREAYDLPGVMVESVAVSGGNGNGAVDPNECNALQITLFNLGDTTATHVLARLSTTTPGVAVVVSVSPYPDIPSSGSAANLVPFKVNTAPSFVCGTPIDFQLVVKSDQETRTNQFQLATGTLGSPLRFDNNVAFPIPDFNPVGVSSPITISNLTGAVGKVAVSLYITHTFDADLTLQLISPDGTTNTLAANLGGSGRNYGSGCAPDSSRTTFDDSATNSIGSAAPPFVGTFRPQLPLSQFVGKSGTNANGTWQLHVVDGFPQDTGILQCWSLFVYPATCTDGGGSCPGVDLAIGMTDNPDPVIIGSNLVYTITVTNNGPNLAKGVAVNQALPGSVIYVSAVSSQGSIGQAGGLVTCTLGNLDVGATASITVTVLPTAPGAIASTATVASNDTDIDPSNNSVTVLTTVFPPSTDLAVGIAGAPNPAVVGGTLTYTVSVTNNGPATATGVVLSNTLPVSVVLNSAIPSQGTVFIAGNVVICNLGSLTNAGSASVTLVVTPTAAGTVLATASVAGNQPDPLLVNNTYTLATTVGPAADLALSIVDTPDPVVVRSNLTYFVTVTNGGPNTATNVVVNQTLPGNISVVSVTVPQGTFLRTGSSLLCNLGSLAVGANVTITVVVNSSVIGTLTTSATVTAGQSDPAPANNTATAASQVAGPFVSIVPAGATLRTEGFAPPNGAIDAGETVTVDLRLRNAGNVSNTNLTATLLATNGITPVGTPQQVFGYLLPSGLPVARPFSFTANGANGTIVTATLQLQDGSNDLGLVGFSFTLPRLASFANSGSITIPQVGAAAPYPSTITVSGVTGTVGRVTATLNGLSHTYIADVDVLLVGPTGQKTVLMSSAGAGFGVTNVNVVFDDYAAAPVPASDQILSGSYAPENYSGDLSLPTNAPAGPYVASMSVFGGSNPNGKWSLYVADHQLGDDGSIVNGWSLAITTVTPVNRLADLSLAASAAPNSVLVGNNLTYSLVVTNSGPDAASGVALTNFLPAGVQLVSVSSSQWSVSTNGGIVFASLSSLNTNSSASVTFVVTPLAAGVLSNWATVVSSEVDLNPANNTARLLTTAALPRADLAVTGTGAPDPVIVGSNLTYTITVNNAGPENALNVVVTNQLPVGVAFVSANASSGSWSNVNGAITFNLGTLAPGAGASLSVTVAPLVAGALTNVVVVGMSSSDNSASNNTATIVNAAANPAPAIMAAGSTLLQESFAPPNDTIEPGETVTLALSLQNAGLVGTSNLVATLLATGGVTAPSGPKSFGALLPGGPAGTQSFTFTAGSGSLGVIVLTLQLVDGPLDLGTAVFSYNLPASASFRNNDIINIPDHGAATPYPASITVSGMTGLVSRVTAALNHVNHGFPDDIDVLLVSPAGRKVVLMSRAGGGHAVTNLNLAFSDSATNWLPDSDQLISGTFKPTDYAAADLFPPSAPGGAAGKTLATLDGTDPNGTWTLYVYDHTVGDAGNIAAGWSLSIDTINPINPQADVGVTVAGTPDPCLTGSLLAYTVNVTNRGPAKATGVTVSNALPAGVDFVSANSSQGLWTNLGATVVFNLGSLDSEAGAVLTIVARPNYAGPATNTVTVASAEVEPSPVDNSAQIVTSVLNPVPARLTGEYVAANDTFRLTVTAQAGETYVIQASTNLTAWTGISTNVAPSNGVIKFTDSGTTARPYRFYRSVRVP